MLLAQIAFSTFLASTQEKPDQSGLPKLKEIMHFLQASDPCQISGSRFTESTLGIREYEGDIQIYRQGKNLKYSYCGFFGDNFVLIVNSKNMSIASDDDPAISDAPKSWAQFTEKQSAQSNGGAVISFLAPEKDLNLFVDTTKAITLETQSAQEEISYFHIDGSKHSVRLLPDHTVEFLTTNPGFSGFRPPFTEIDSLQVRKHKATFPTWYFEIKK
ncbi:MAG: hypothetical protein ACKVQS_06960 [Fimbriimonadaceae bacterium]